LAFSNFNLQRYNAGLNTVHFVSFMAFYSRVSDADMGGTYMTLLNTVSNLGFKWVETSMMFAIDAVSSKQCVVGLCTLNQVDP
jgi:PAT family acetyl-CoA transporter-like MFS transporter 1